MRVLKFNDALTGNNSKSIDNVLIKFYDRTVLTSHVLLRKLYLCLS